MDVFEIGIISLYTFSSGVWRVEKTPKAAKITEPRAVAWIGTAADVMTC